MNFSADPLQIASIVQEWDREEQVYIKENYSCF